MVECMELRNRGPYSNSTVCPDTFLAGKWCDRPGDEFDIGMECDKRGSKLSTPGCD